MFKNLDPLTIKQLIMDHYEYPHHKGLKTDRSYREIHMAADSCIDDIKLQIKIKDNIIKDICFDGKACTISTASTSMMTELVIGKSVTEALNVIKEYEKMINLKEYDENLLQEANVFNNVGRQANRIGCAMIGWNALKKLLKEYHNSIDCK